MLTTLSHLFDGLLRPLIEMSATAAFVAVIVFLLRLILKKRAPGQVICLMWLLVFVRLLLPVALETPFSLVPDLGDLAEQPAQSQPVEEEPVQTASTAPVETAPIQVPPAQTSPVQTVPGQSYPVSTAPVQTAPIPTTPVLPDDPQPTEPAQSTLSPVRYILPVVWIAGVAAMVVYAVVSFLLLRRRVFDAIRTEQGVWEHPTLRSPFILGLIRPRIYLPMGLDDHTRGFILLHERAHLRRLDHIVKPICWVALAIHWYNPFAWAAFLLMSRDMEAACDDRVLEQLGLEIRADYSSALLELATSRRFPAPSPLSFGEGDAKFRIKNVLSFKKPALWVTIVAVVVAIVAAVTLLTNPTEKPEYYTSEAYPGIEFRVETDIVGDEILVVRNTWEDTVTQFDASIMTDPMDSFRQTESFRLINSIMEHIPDWVPDPDAEIVSGEFQSFLTDQLHPWQQLEVTGDEPEDPPTFWLTPAGNLLILDWEGQSQTFKFPQVSTGSLAEEIFPGHTSDVIFDIATVPGPGWWDRETLGGQWTYYQEFIGSDGVPWYFSLQLNLGSDGMNYGYSYDPPEKEGPIDPPETDDPAIDPDWALVSEVPGFGAIYKTTGDSTPTRLIAVSGDHQTRWLAEQFYSAAFRDLDGDGVEELCVHSAVGAGGGLYDILTVLEPEGDSWTEHTLHGLGMETYTGDFRDLARFSQDGDQLTMRMLDFAYTVELDDEIMAMDGDYYAERNDGNVALSVTDEGIVVRMSGSIRKDTDSANQWDHPLVADFELVLKAEYKNGVFEYTPLGIESSGDRTGLLATWQADLDHDGVDDTITVKQNYYEGDTTPWWDVTVTDAEGTQMWSRQVYSFHAGWNGIYLYEKEGKQYLMEWLPYGSTGGFTYHYSVYSLTGAALDNNIFILADGTFEYFAMNEESVLAIDTDAMRAFEAEVNSYLADAMVLLVMDEDSGGLRYSTADDIRFEQWTSPADHWDEMKLSIGIGINHPAGPFGWSGGIVTAATLPDAPDQYYLVAELPEESIYLYARNNGQQGLLYFEGNLTQPIGRTIHGDDLTLPVMSMEDGCLTIVYSPGDVVRYTWYPTNDLFWVENGIYADTLGNPVLVANGHFGPLPDDIKDDPSLQVLSDEAAIHVTGYDHTQGVVLMGCNLFEGKPVMERYHVLTWENGRWVKVLPAGLSDSAWMAASTPLGEDRLYVVPGEGHVLYTGGKLYPLGDLYGDDPESLIPWTGGTFLYQSNLYAGEGPVPGVTVLTPTGSGWTAVELDPHEQVWPEPVFEETPYSVNMTLGSINANFSQSGAYPLPAGSWQLSVPAGLHSITVQGDSVTLYQYGEILRVPDDPDLPTQVYDTCRLVILARYENGRFTQELVEIQWVTEQHWVDYQIENGRVLITGLNASYLEYDPDNGSLYLADPRFLGELFVGEGSAQRSGDTIRVSFTRNQDSTSGAVHGASLSFEADLGQGTVTVLRSEPYQGSTIDLTEARMAEIGAELADLIHGAQAYWQQFGSQTP